MLKRKSQASLRYIRAPDGTLQSEKDFLSSYSKLKGQRGSTENPCFVSETEGSESAVIQEIIEDTVRNNNRLEEEFTTQCPNNKECTYNLTQQGTSRREDDGKEGNKEEWNMDEEMKEFEEDILRFAWQIAAGMVSGRKVFSLIICIHARLQ